MFLQVLHGYTKMCILVKDHYTHLLHCYTHVLHGYTPLCTCTFYTVIHRYVHDLHVYTIEI